MQAEPLNSHRHSHAGITPNGGIMVERVDGRYSRMESSEVRMRVEISIHRSQMPWSGGESGKTP